LGTGGARLQGSHAIAGFQHAAAMGLAQTHQSLADSESTAVVGARLAEVFADTHHPRLGLGGGRAYSAAGGKLTMSWPAVAALKQQIPLLDYLQGQDWKPVRRIADGKLLGLCPLHADHQPSFLLDPQKSLFYCYGCGRGGDLIRFAELYHGVRFTGAMTLLRRWTGMGSLLQDVTRFCQVQLHRHSEAMVYLQQRGLHQAEVIEEFRIGYAPGRCLRAWLTTLGYPLEYLQQAGLVNADGHDTFHRRIVFPLESNLYGRSIGSAVPHRFLPGGKGGLYGWDKVRRCADLILVEGMFDLAALWQAGFRNVSCALGSHLNASQFRQLCADDGRDGSSRTVYLALDSDPNGSGQKAAQCLAQRLRAEGITTRQVELPDGHDPNSFFVGGGNAHEFQCLLERASL
jgi:DNA primase